MTRLGWHFAFIGTFAMVGGAIRGFNLPLVLAGLVVGALLMHWRLGRGTIEGIVCRRRLPDEAFVGQPFAVRFLITHHGRWLPALLLRVDDDVELASDSANDTSSSSLKLIKKPFDVLSLVRQSYGSAVASCGVGNIPAGRTMVAKYDCIASKRGRYQFGPAVVSTGTPLGLMTVQKRSSETQSLCVFPQLMTLRRDWRQRLQSRSGGMATTARRSGASEGDFFGLRSWQAGDSRRWIHWRTTARIGEPAVRQFEQLRRFDLCVLLDAFVPAGGGDGDVAIELAISATASLMAQIVPTPTNRAALAVAGSTNAVVTSGGNRDQLTAMLRVLAEVKPTSQPDLIAAVDNVFRSIGKPQDLLIVSPRKMPPAAELIGKMLNGRCSVRWYSFADGSLDLLVDRGRGFSGFAACSSNPS